jgi:hypothetical protein
MRAVRVRVSAASVELFQRDADVVEVSLKLGDSRELHSLSTLHSFKLLGDPGEDGGELGNHRTVLP